MSLALNKVDKWRGVDGSQMRRKIIHEPDDNRLVVWFWNLEDTTEGRAYSPNACWVYRMWIDGVFVGRVLESVLGYTTPRDAIFGRMYRNGKENLQ